MKKQLIILTDSFPFENGEEFLITENKYYEGFDEVIICPVFASNYSSEKRYDKEKCTILKINNGRDNRIKRVLWCIKGILSFEFWDELFWLIKKNKFSKQALYQLVVEIERAKRVSYKIEKQLGDAIDKNNTVVYSYWVTEAKIAIEIKKKHPNVIAISRAHGGDLYEYRYRSDYLPLRREIFSRINKLYPISLDGKEYLENRYANCISKVEVARLGIEKASELIQVYPSRKTTLKVVSCSYCRPLKRIHLIIQALSQLKIDVEWVHIGGGDELDKLKKLADEILPANVHYNFYGYVENSEIQQLYLKNKFHVFINVSETEGIPVSIMEALSCSIPVIATEVGGVPEMIRNNYNGLLLPKSFRNFELVDCINKISEMPETEYQELRKNAWKTWSISYNANTNYKKFVNQLLSMLREGD